jgi:ribosomal protein L37AE/L43A
MEAQLDNQRIPEHPRQNDVRDGITEKQLQTEWKGYEQHKQGLEKPRHEITEKQLRGDYAGFDHHVPQDKPRMEVQEGQLRDTGIKCNTAPAGMDGEWSAGVSDQAKQITEGQLDDWKSGGEKPKHEITEKQLREQGDPLGRRIASVTRENAKKVLANALKAMGRTGAHFDCDAGTIVATAMEFQGNPRSGMAAISTMESLCDANNMKLMRTAAKNGDAGIKDYLLAELVDSDLSPDVALQAMKVLACDENLDKIASEIETAKVPPEIQLPAEDILRQALTDEPKKEAKVEDIKVVMEADEISADSGDKEAFAKAVFEKATKLASEQGVTVTERVHVRSLGKGKVEAAMKGIQKEAKTCVECGKEEENECDCEKESSSKKEAKLAERSEGRKKTVEAQFDSGGGGMPSPGMEAGGQAGGGTTMPTPAPNMGMMEEPVGALGGEEAASEDSIDDNPESKPPGSICPSCGSEDVGVESGEFGCNNCGAKGTIEVNLNVHNWPDTIQEKGPTGDHETDEGIGDMEGGPGMEMPDAGIAASLTFKITPEMVKIANQKQVGSWCPHCGSNKVEKQAKKTHVCETCNGPFRVDTYVNQEDQALMGRIAWYDQNVRKLANDKKRKIAVARVNAKKKMAAISQKREKLTLALKLKGLTTKFAKSDLKGRATIISLLHDEGLI